MPPATACRVPTTRDGEGVMPDGTIRQIENRRRDGAIVFIGNGALSSSTPGPTAGKFSPGPGERLAGGQAEYRADPINRSSPSDRFRHGLSTSERISIGDDEQGKPVGVEPGSN